LKLVLSRKGFDSASGGIPSPILPDGALLSLPIPSRPAARGAATRFRDVRLRGVPLGELVADLSGGRLRGDEAIHLDPDLVAAALPRAPGWRPLLGQVGAAQSHLAAHGVGRGDLFLFYGWFRAVERAAERWRYARGAPDLHLIFGWLEVDAVHRVDAGLGRRLPWAAYHPHLHGRWPGNNTLYAAADGSARPRSAAALGAGTFSRFRPALQLTSPGAPRSRWRLPRWAHPGEGRAPLSFHADPRRWSLAPEGVLLASARRGQEFVLDLAAYPEAAGWLRELLAPA
jgi:hypothetical protein